MIRKIGRNIVGPIMLDYVLWVLKTAEERNIKVLYFLARDGYLLQKIALLICKQYNLDIQCRYLYCSRLSLRMPTYGFIGKEAWDLIFVKSYLLTLNIVFDRLQLTEAEKQKVLKEADIEIGINHSLTEREYACVKETLKNSAFFNELLIEKSQLAFENIISYFRQEELLNCKHIGVVDSGWTGSMQRSLRQILDRAQKNIKITGFYFGSFYNKHDLKDGEYLNWYFSENNGFWRKVFFCNNVLEAFLSAPHGMTLGFYFTGSKWMPLLKLDKNREEFYKAVTALDESCLKYVREQLEHMDYYNLHDLDNADKVYVLLRRFMVFPTREEVDAFVRFKFCDDLSESYENSLAGDRQINLLKNYSICKRVWRKLFRKTADRNEEMLFWAYGTASYASRIKCAWYRLNIIIWEALRYYKQKSN